MTKRIHFGSEATMLELIIAIGFFAVFTALNLRIFASAHIISDESDRLTHAVIAAENVAECFKAGLEAPLYYDDHWLAVEENSAEYVLTLEQSSQNAVQTAVITVKDKNDRKLFILTTKTPSEVSP